jgi:hypothetical protein
MSLTMPQIVMLNHAAYVNRTNSERRYEAERERDDKLKGREPRNPTSSDSHLFKPDFSKMNSDEIVGYVMEDLAVM